ncbi:uncharacterized protein LOC135495016 [Lineus longissimus]|uniref:uncharacterized protein LOC135495016 n=1 Tax=Lineus longissimus TaxID=88925 RepID=UPI00315D3301
MKTALRVVLAVLVLFTTAEAVTDLHYLGDGVEKEGDDAHLYCKLDGANGREQMSWKREGDAKRLLEGTQPFDDRIKVEKRRHGVIELTITDLKPEDTRNYTCLVRLESGKMVTKTRLLIIEYMTRFSSRQHMFMKYHSIGGSTSISCQADGHPGPSYRWYKDNTLLSDNSTFNIVDKGGKSTLKILTSADDNGQWIFGTYSCKATNQHGSAVMQYKLQAAAIPEKTANITVKTTRSTYVELGVAEPGDTGGLPITGYRVRWMEEVEESMATGGGGGVEGEGGGFGVAGGEGAEGGQAHSVSSQVFNIGDPIVVPGLDPGKKYVFEIAAMNEAGVGKTVFRNIQTPESDEEVGAVVYPSGSSGLYALWVFLAILIFFILLLLLFLLLWCCGWLTSTALICCPCCAKYCPDCLGCCSTLCWCLPLFSCCVCCGRSYRGSSYDVLKKKKIPLCVCCPTDGVAISSRMINKIRLLTLQRNEKTEVGVNSAFSTAAKVTAGSVGVNATDGYARGYYLHNDFKGKSDTMTTRKTDTMTSRKSDTTKNTVFSYDIESSSSEGEQGMNTMETQTSGNNFTVNSRYIGRDNHVTRDVFLDHSGKKVKMFSYPAASESIQTYSLASDWNRTRSKERLARSYDDELDVSEPVLKRISKRDERYSSQPMGEHLSRRDSVNRDRKRRSSVEVITFYQPGEQVPSTRDAKIQIYTNDDECGSLPRRIKLAQLYHDTRVDVDHHLRSSSIPRNAKLSAMVDMGDPTSVDYGRDTATYTEVKRRKDMSKYATAPVVRRTPRYTTDEATQTLRRSKYENEFDIPLERVPDSRDPSQQRNQAEQQDQRTDYSEVLTQKTRHIRSQREVPEVIYRPITIETKETNTMTKNEFDIPLERVPPSREPSQQRNPTEPQDQGRDYSEVHRHKTRHIRSQREVPEVIYRPITIETKETNTMTKNEFDIPLERVSPSRDPSHQRKPAEPQDQRTDYSEVHRHKTRHIRSQQEVPEVIYRPITIETRETNTMTKNEFDIPLERVPPSREPSQQRNTTEPQDQGTDYSEVHRHKTRHIRSQQEVPDVIYRPITIETKETNTMTERPKRWSRPPTPPHAAPTYRTFPIEMEQTTPKHKPVHRRPPAKPHRSKPKGATDLDIEEPIQCTVRPNVESGQAFDFDALDHLESANIETQTDFPLDADSITKESHGRWPEEPPLQAVEPNYQDHWPGEAHVRASLRDPEQRGRWLEEDQPQAVQLDQREQWQVEAPVQASLRDPEQRGRWLEEDPPQAVQLDQREQWQVEAPVQASLRDPEQRGRWLEEDPPQAVQLDQREQWQVEAPVLASLRDPVQRGRWLEKDQPQAVQLDQREQWEVEAPVLASLRAPVQKGSWADDVQPENLSHMPAPGLERGIPFYRPQHGQEVMEQTMVRRNRSIEFLESMEHSEMSHQYAKGPEVIFVDSGNYSLEEPQRPEPEHHLEVSPPETHDFFEETETIESTDVTEEAVTEVNSYETHTDTKTQAMEVQSSQSAFQEYSASRAEYRGETGGASMSGGHERTSATISRFGGTGDAAMSGGHESSSATMSRVGGTGGAAISGGHESSSATMSRVGGTGGAAMSGGNESSSATMSRVGGTQGAAGYSYQEKQSAYSGYSVQSSHGTEGRTFLTVERQGDGPSPSFDLSNERRSYWRV